MTHQRIVEIWKALEAIDNSKTELYNELFDEIYQGKYQDVYVGILQKHLDMQQELVLIDMQETFRELSIEPSKGGDDDEIETQSDDTR
jgi:hypothetical protein